jgi:hypothetical protein
MEAVLSRQHGANLLATANAWSCNHCQEFLSREKAETIWVVSKHLKEW